ncbi:MAG: hypothetical protein HN390_02085 [Anaerolineae bacterium]|jgi:hypothetical protein|nr:hypothetical protein [Anaerolineae bacterium]MBT7189043.1 hypothetical protein [Anaerolineae bacterium]MBT7990316.1 hypothetical protein [Anaerolineae bacterium]
MAESARKLVFKTHLSTFERILFFIVGLFPLLAPYELLIKPSWNGEYGLIFFFFFLLSLGALSVSFFFIAATFLGRKEHYIFDAEKRVLVYRYKNVFIQNREENYPFSAIRSLWVKTSVWDSGPDTYDIALDVGKKRPYQFGQYAERKEAEEYFTRLQKMTGVENAFYSDK